MLLRIPTAMRSRIVIPEVTVGTILDQTVEARDKHFGWLVWLLAAPIKLCTLEYDTLPYLEESIKFGEYQIVLFSVVCRDVGESEDILCVLSHAEYILVFDRSQR